MKEMYKDGAGNWHYGIVGETLPEISYSADSIPTGTMGSTADTISVERLESYIRFYGNKAHCIREMVDEWNEYYSEHTFRPLNKNEKVKPHSFTPVSRLYEAHEVIPVEWIEKWFKENKEKVGHWIYSPTEVLGYVCSECGKGSCRWNYCPHCGTKMKEEENEV